MTSPSTPDPRKALFDRWAPSYDEAIERIAEADAYPFAGYERVLDRITHHASMRPGASVLDLGTGTANLAARLLRAGCRVTGTDVSPIMLEHARAKFPELTLIEADIRKPWPPAIDGPFDAIVSAYVLHEFDHPTKLAILQQAARRLAPAARIVIADIAFPNRRAHDEAQQRWKDRWDHEEHPWIADESLNAAPTAGLRAQWEQASPCAGIFIFEPV